MSRYDQMKNKKSYCPNAILTYCLMTKRKDGKNEKPKCKYLYGGGGGRLSRVYNWTRAVGPREK